MHDFAAEAEALARKIKYPLPMDEDGKIDRDIMGALKKVYPQVKEL